MLDAATWLKVAESLASGRAGAPGTALGALNLSVVTALGLANSAMLRVDRAIWPGIDAHDVLPPLFVVGNARSGTTLFHRLLCEDTERFFHFDLWEILLPSLTQRWIVHRMAGLDARIRGSLAALLERLDLRAFGDLQRLHPIGLLRPEEDELLMMPAFASSTLCVLFPDPKAHFHWSHFDGLPEADRRRAMAYYRACVRRRSIEAGGRRVLCSKNPTFVSKLRSLSEEFPEARFAYLVRDPVETLPSLLGMLTKVWRDLKIADALARDAATAIGEACIRDYLYAIETLDRLPKGSVAVIRYVDLVASPSESVLGAYAHFGWPPSDDLRSRLVAADQRQRRHEDGCASRLEDFGFVTREVVERLDAVYERFELPRPTRHGATP